MAPTEKPSDKRSALDLFRALAGGADDQIDLVEGALLIAQQEYAHLDRDAYRRRLDEMSAEARRVCGSPPALPVPHRLGQFSRLFADRWGFRGNRDDYYDPRNSLLNDVLDRRTGIPITLAVVYMEIGRRAGLDLVGVGMPGHFLVGCRDRRDLFVDAFCEGALLTPADCAARLRELRPDAVFRPEFLEPVGPRIILTRILNNLLAIYGRAENFVKELAMIEMIICLQPDEAGWLKQRAIVHFQLNNYAGAIADLERYLQRAPHAADGEDVTQRLAMLHRLRAMVN